MVFSFAMKRRFRMKKHLIIAGIICSATIPPAYAVTKCVKLTPSTTCTSTSGALGQSNWSVTCGGIEIQGVGFCGSQKGGSAGAPTETVTISATADDNIDCWCKMVSPAVSSWVFGNSHPSAGGCAYNCARNCAYRARDYSTFRSALFSGLSD